MVEYICGSHISRNKYSFAKFDTDRLERNMTEYRNAPKKAKRAVLIAKEERYYKLGKK